MTASSGSLWDFSLSLYTASGVESVCLRMQDDFQAKVTILLWCCWLEVRNVHLTSARLAQAQQRLAPWDDTVIKPLRQLRREIRQQYGVDEEAIEACRQKIKSAELAAEQVALSWLESLSCEWEAAPAPVRRGENAECYLRILKVPDRMIGETVATLSCISGIG